MPSGSAPSDDEMEQAQLDGVRLRAMTAAEAQEHFERCLHLLEESRDDWSRTYVARLARLLHRRLVELGAVPDPSSGPADESPSS